MGMAASQARLLSLTARLHDVEFEAQSIEWAKLKLADQEDAVYQEYLNALDATVITGQLLSSSGTTSTVPATFRNLCGDWQSMLSKSEGVLSYGLVNQSSGKLYVTQAMYDAYKEYKGNDNNSDSDEFALIQLGYTDEEAAAYIKYRDNGSVYYELDNNTGAGSINLKTVNTTTDDYSSSQVYYVLGEESNGYVLANISDYLTKDENGNKIWDTEKTANITLFTEQEDDDTETPAATVADITAMKSALNTSEAKYYKYTYEMIQCVGGCEVLDTQYQNSSDWLTQMVENCSVGIYILEEDSSTSSGYSIQQSSVASSTDLSETSVSSIDQTALAKAEAEYNQALKKIDNKDTMYDMSLEELETERTSITTELESLRTVIDDNVERTFGVFS